MMFFEVMCNRISERAMSLSLPVSRIGVVIVSIVTIVAIIALVMWLPY